MFSYVFLKKVDWKFPWYLPTVPGALLPVPKRRSSGHGLSSYMTWLHWWIPNHYFRNLKKYTKKDDEEKKPNKAKDPKDSKAKGDKERKGKDKKKKKSKDKDGDAEDEQPQPKRARKEKWFS